jgi:dolichol-phosphate mannosyltransferase
MEPELDIVIPVYNEGRHIVATLSLLARSVKTPARVLICYDHAEDDTLPAIRHSPTAYAGLPVDFVRNTGRGAHGAVMSGFAASKAPFILMYPADDDYNAPLLDGMVAAARGGCDVVCASLSCRAAPWSAARSSKPCWCVPGISRCITWRACRPRMPATGCDCSHGV